MNISFETRSFHYRNAQDIAIPGHWFARESIGIT